MMFLASLACNLVLSLTAWRVRDRRRLWPLVVWFLSWGTVLTFALVVSSLPAVTFVYLLLTILLATARSAKWSHRVFLSCSCGCVIAAYCGAIWIYIPKFTEHQRLLARFPAVHLGSRLNHERPEAMRQRSYPDVANLERDYAATLRSSTAMRKRLAFQGLLEMHENFVLDFIAQPGLGVGRMNGFDVVREATFDLKAEKPEESIAVAPLIRQQPDSVQRNKQADVLASQLSSQSTWQETSFTSDELGIFEKLNRQAVVRFVPALSLGGVGSQQTARGFQSHAFQQEIDDVDLKGSPKDWTVSRLELISLWKHSPPVAYVSEYLPAMKELRDAPTRRLSAFEARAIRRLQDGEEIVATSESEGLRMVGAIRAIEDCRGCHRVSLGGLLGAFSYRFR